MRATYSVKISIVQGGQTEHIWMEVDDYRGGVFHGRLGNDPQLPGKHRFGDEMTVREADVEDWMVNTGEHRYGAYTIRVLLKQLPRREAEALRRQIRD